MLELSETWKTPKRRYSRGTAWCNASFEILRVSLKSRAQDRETEIELPLFGEPYSEFSQSRHLLLRRE